MCKRFLEHVTGCMHSLMSTRAHPPTTQQILFPLSKEDMNKLGAGIWKEITEVALYMSIRHAKKYSVIIPVTLINAWL